MWLRARLLPLLALLPLAAPLPAAAADADGEHVSQALKALRRGNVAQLEARMSELSAGSPELEYVRYRLALHHLEDDDPALAVRVHADTPSGHIRKRLGVVLASHYARQGDEMGYLEFRPAEGGNVALCGDAIFGAEDDPATVRGIWRSVDIGEHKVCDHLFRAALRNGALGDEDLWGRLRRYAGTRQLSKARKVALLLPSRERPSVNALKRAIYRATGRIKSKHSLDTRAQREMVAVSAMVATRGDPALALRRWEKFSVYYPESTNQDVWLAIALWSAKYHRKDAPGLFRRVDRERYGDEERAWRVRAGLRAGDWGDVLETVESMPPAQAEITAWRYWRAVALARLEPGTGEGEAALAALGESADDFYGLLARETLGRPVVRDSGPPAITPQERERVENDFDLRLARVVERTGLPWQGLRIWREAVAGFTPGEQLAASELAQRQGSYLASTFTADAVPPGERSLRLSFPTPYFELVREYVEELGLDLAFVYGLIRQESRFMPEVVSSANARGLMQVLPATAKKVARKHSFTRYRTSRLTLPKTNIIIGTHYLDELQHSLEDDPILMAAGYNAGPGRPKRWKSRSTGIDRLVYIETIPITETRLYVKHLIANAAHYDRVLGLREPSVLRRIAGSY